MRGVKGHKGRYDQFFDKDTLENENMEIAPKNGWGMEVGDASVRK